MAGDSEAKTAPSTPEASHREQALNDREQALRDRELLLNSREQALFARDELLRGREQAVSQREAALSERDAQTKNEEIRLRDRAQQLEESGAYLEELFARSDRYGLQQAAKEAAQVVEQVRSTVAASPEAPPPVLEEREEIEDVEEIEEVEESAVWDQDDVNLIDSNLYCPVSRESQPSAANATFTRGEGDWLRSDESVLYADMRRLRLLPDGSSASGGSENVLD